MFESNHTSPGSVNDSICFQDVSVRYRVPTEHIQSFKEYIIRTIQGKVNHYDFWAFHNINLEVREGEVFGIVGRNGAGKSTLLKLVARVLRPTSGRVSVNGLLESLLELGAEFHSN